MYNLNVTQITEPIYQLSYRLIMIFYKMLTDDEQCSKGDTIKYGLEIEWYTELRSFSLYIRHQFHSYSTLLCAQQRPRLVVGKTPTCHPKEPGSKPGNMLNMLKLNRRIHRIAGQQQPTEVYISKLYNNFKEYFWFVAE